MLSLFLAALGLLLWLGGVLVWCALVLVMSHGLNREA